MKWRELTTRLVAVLGLTVLGGCSQADVVSELRSLSGSGETVFLCRADSGEGHPFTDCPDHDASDDLDPSKRLSMLALVTQTVTDEVAVVDVTAGHVLDVDPSLPGYGFLRVGGRPVSLATTPGGNATFVATADVGRNGLFALPTQCLRAPSSGRLELTTWPACRLDETPGEMTVLVEPAGSSSTSACAGYDPEAQPKQEICGLPADVIKEGGPEGRRKLLVSFPDSGKLRVYDAQALLDLPPGTFPRCEPEVELDLKVDVPQGVAQTLPQDLETTCSEVLAPTAPPPGKRGAQPAGLAVADDRLYIADRAAPVIHVLDTSRACALTELPSLLPMSLREPDRAVVTRRVAVSPLTPAGQRFVYAIDAEDQPAASVMVFDVSPGSTNVTPLVRPGAPELPNVKPDRLWLSSTLQNVSARDVTFAYRDIPYVDPATGAAEFGVRCDPDPALSGQLASVLARPNGDYTVGARPGLLRGLFGFVLFTDGQIAVVDEDDLDGDCRRPIQSNPTATPDERGCVNDPIASFYTNDETIDGTRLVTAETSCRMVEPHQVRSARLAINDTANGVRTPSLRGFPQLGQPNASVPRAVADLPRLLAVPYAGPQGEAKAAEVYMGSVLYRTDRTGAELLPTDPNGAESEQQQSFNSVVLPPLEPRAYAAEDTVSVTYEGSYAGDRDGGFLDEATGELSDPGRSFCGAGVYDVATMTDYAQSVLGLDGDAAAAFGEQHADYVQLMTGFLLENDSYWRSAGVNRNDCIAEFGTEDADIVPAARDLSIVSAYGDRLVLQPSGGVTFARIKQCFPAAQRYRLRAKQHWVVTRASSGFRHDVVESADRRCVRSCNPLRKWDRGRVFEISSTPGENRDKCRAIAANPIAEPSDEVVDPLTLRVGCALENETACVFDQTASPGVQIGGPAANCIFDGLTERFALYRGRAPSVRDEAFRWQTTGGFSPLVMSLGTISTTVSPQSIQFVTQAEQLAVVDGASQGLSLFSLDTFTVVTPSPFY